MDDVDQNVKENIDGQNFEATPNIKQCKSIAFDDGELMDMSNQYLDSYIT